MKKVDSLTFRGFEINGVQFITDSVVCPFCGGHATIDHIEDFGDSLTLKIRCKDCGEEFERDVEEEVKPCSESIKTQILRSSSKKKG